MQISCQLRHDFVRLYTTQRSLVIRIYGKAINKQEIICAFNTRVYQKALYGHRIQSELFNFMWPFLKIYLADANMVTSHVRRGKEQQRKKRIVSLKCVATRVGDELPTFVPSPLPALLLISVSTFYHGHSKDDFPGFSPARLDASNLFWKAWFCFLSQSVCIPFYTRIWNMRAVCHAC